MNAATLKSQCALCLQEAELRNSHIIPEFMYRALYDEKHRFRQLTALEDEDNSYKQKGIRERLLCDACEQRFSVVERYASQLFHGGLGINVVRKGDRLYIAGVDYHKLKLFQLSILWRAGASRLPEFAVVDLGPHAEKIRVMLLNDNPGPCGSYGCVTVALMMDDWHTKGLIIPPSDSRLDGQIAYMFAIGGYIFSYPVSSTPPRRAIRSHLLQEDGSLIVKIEQVKNVGYVMDTLKKLQAMGRFDD